MVFVYCNLRISSQCEYILYYSSYLKSVKMVANLFFSKWNLIIFLNKWKNYLDGIHILPLSTTESFFISLINLFFDFLFVFKLCHFILKRHGHDLSWKFSNFIFLFDKLRYTSGQSKFESAKNFILPCFCFINAHYSSHT